MIINMHTIAPTKHIKVVDRFTDLTDTVFTGDNNALCWQRTLKGNFKEIVQKLALKENITEISIEDLLVLDLSDEGALARETIIDDLNSLTNIGAIPSLNLLKEYERDEEYDFISTDVYSFHVDRAPICSDTYLCTYYGAASDIVANDEVEQKILIPEIRTQLRSIYEGPEEEFDEFLKDNFFDLHYQLKENATPINLGNGHLWRLAVDAPQQQVLPCVHHAPKENQGEYRLMLIC